ncbi:MAG: phage tail protein I [Sphingomonadales bacterium RIFCSPHIGHO2_01_FULL_65_20]|nr:MAG: phage tail protein I [Sphingomonadales bacterium RIFCSPHIGHO2_01_FULL_65_20]
MTIDPDILAASLLPPNSTDGERALEDAMRARIDLTAVGKLWDPATCPAHILPFLAWGLAIARWDPEWTEAEKRAATADAIAFHRRKGTRGIVRQVLDRFNPLLELVEWWEASPRRDPHTFEVRAPAGVIPAAFLTAEVAEAIIRDVASVKPARSHFTFVQNLQAEGEVWLAGGAVPATFTRLTGTAEHDDDPIWANALLDQNGEPIVDGDGSILEII